MKMQKNIKNNQKFLMDFMVILTLNNLDKNTKILIIMSLIRILKKKLSKHLLKLLISETPKNHFIMEWIPNATISDKISLFFDPKSYCNLIFIY